VLETVYRRTRAFPAGEQCDPHELFMFLLQSFDTTAKQMNELSGQFEFSLTSPLFESRVSTMARDGTLTREDAYSCVPIAIGDGHAPLTQGIDRFLNGDESLDRGEEFTVIRQFMKLPPVLVFQIERFRPTMFGIVKDARHVPMAMNIEIPGGDAIYGFELCAVVMHLGESIERGHYQAVYAQDGKWILADDDRVSVLDIRTVQKFLSDGELPKFGYKPAPYLLFYEMHMK
jgi:uncharacterized UBP type Zn finger protein